MQYDICFKTTSHDVLIAALEIFGLTHIPKDNDGNDLPRDFVYGSSSHTFAYVGQIVDTPAVIGDDMTVTTPATYLPGEYAILRAEESLLKQIMAGDMDGVEVLAEPPVGCRTFGEWRTIPAGPTLQEVRAKAILTATALCDDVLAPFGVEYGVWETATFDQQYAEALAYTADPAASVPLLSAMCLARGISVATLAGKIIANRAAWVGLTGYVIGQRQRIVTQIEAATSVEAVLAVDMTINLPG